VNRAKGQITISNEALVLCVPRELDLSRASVCIEWPRLNNGVLHVNSRGGDIILRVVFGRAEANDNTKRRPGRQARNSRRRKGSPWRQVFIGSVAVGTPW